MVSAIIVAAGRGTRMGAEVDKLFLEVAGRPLVAHTWERFDRSPSIDEVVVVIREAARPRFEEIARGFGPVKPFRLVEGGKERQNSVWNGLQAVAGRCELAAIQDGARPCTAESVIRDTIAAARATGAAVAASRVTDTIKEGNEEGMIARNVDRSRLWAVQTPQVFRVEVIRRALEEVLRRGLLVTDDTAACELIGQRVKLVDGGEPNPKATSPADLPYIESLLERMKS